MLRTDEQFPSIGSQQKGWRKMLTAPVDVYFPWRGAFGKDGNWLQTVPGKSWNFIHRLYGRSNPDLTKPGGRER
jgi:hypothetical protein